MNSRLHIDFETRSHCDLKRAGAYSYARHRTTEVTHLGYKFDNHPTYQWKPGQEFPHEVAAHVGRGGVVVCHNAGFERRVWNFTLRRMVSGLPEMSIEQQSCTMARALILGYPAQLEQLARVLNVSEKDATGKAILLKYAKPYDGEYKIPTPEHVAMMDTYNVQDVEVESQVDHLLPELTPRERAIWILDQHINDRGLPVNIDEVLFANELALDAKRRVGAEIRALTGGFVQAVTEAAKIVDWLQGRGFAATSASEFELNQLVLDEDNPHTPAARKLVELRTSGAKSSVAKFQKMLDCVGADGRLRDQYSYAQAGTARWASRLVQVQNLKRLDLEKDGGKIAEVFQAFDLDLKGAEAACYIEFMTGDPVLEVLARSMRRFIQAPPGRELFGGDFKNVEGRFNAWVNGEEWKVKAFEAYDAGVGPDLYKLTYSKSFGKALDEVSKSERQIGKVQELALGYQGGVRAFITMGPTYGLRIADLVPTVRAAADPAIWNGFHEEFPSARDKHGLNEECWITAKILVRNYRLQNAKIAAGWYELHDAGVRAVENPGELVSLTGVRGVSYLCHEGFLWCRLPSNRLLAYCQPEVVVEHNDSIVWLDGLVEDANIYTLDDLNAFVASGLVVVRLGKPRKQVRFMGKVKSGWLPKRLYGGLQGENIVQAACRDFQGDAMLRLEARGYPVIAHTHDDIVTERAQGTGSEDEFRFIMAETSTWAQGMPLAVDTWRGTRYGG